MKQIRRKPEILAPAGSIESLKGAIAAGADAVYIGGSRFGARAYAENPAQDILLEAIDYVHCKDRRIYLTVNTLLKEQELNNELVPFLEKYYKAGVDAVIVQDVGVLHFLATHFPDLPVHLSTQMTLVGADGTKLFKDYPVTRMVPARELSLEEIKTIRKNTNLEIECFVHGALCYCYSGQCLFSSMIGGRSGNRGRCAQPCRMAYDVWEDGKTAVSGSYVLSPKDLCTLDRIPELAEAGIDSFKIEGRMKRPEYTAGVTAAYRFLTDLYSEYGKEEFYRYLEQHPGVLQEQKDRMTDLYNRGGFTLGYYGQYHGSSMMSMKRPNHTGTKVGEVVSAQGIRAKIKLEKPVNPQDVLEIRAASGAVYEFTAGRAGIEEKDGWYETNVKKGFPISAGQEVYRTKNEALLKELKVNYVEKQVQMPVDAQFRAIPGEAAVLTVNLTVHQKSSIVAGADEKNVKSLSVTVTGDEVMTAQKQPVSAEKIKEQLTKTGESEFYFKELEVITGDKTFLPMGKIKELRRTAFEKLKEELLSGYRRDLPEKGAAVNEVFSFAKEPKKAPEKQEIIAMVSTEAQCLEAMQWEQFTTIYVDVQGGGYQKALELCQRIKQTGKKAFLVLPHIFRQKEKETGFAMVSQLSSHKLDGFLVKSLEEITFLKENGLTEAYEVRLNSNLYVFQPWAKEFFIKQGICRFTVPMELKEEEIRSLGVADCDFVLYGRQPLMVSAQCIRDNVLTCSAGKKTEGISLKDRMGAEFPVRQNCEACYNTIYNSACFSLLGTGVEQKFSPAGWRFDFTFESPSEIKEVLETFGTGGALFGKGPYTKGHYKRGIE